MQYGVINSGNACEKLCTYMIETQGSAKLLLLKSVVQHAFLTL